MCRNIRTLYNFEPPATEDEVQAAALQYVRKISGFTKPSQANEEAFDAGDRGGRPGVERAARCPEHRRAAKEPRGRGRQGPRPVRAALRGVTGPDREIGGRLLVGGVVMDLIFTASFRTASGG